VIPSKIFFGNLRNGWWQLIVVEVKKWLLFVEVMLVVVEIRLEVVVLIGGQLRK